MKFLLLAALVASISAVEWYTWRPEQDVHIEPRSDKYEPGKEYVYRYRSQVLTGLPTFSNTYGGIKVVSNIKVDVITATSGVLKMEDIQLYSMNTEIGDPNHLKPFHQLPEDLFKPLPPTHAQMITRKLQLPIKFTCNKERMVSMEITDQEVNWSLDIKRSTIQMVQLILKNEDFKTNPKLPYNDLQENNSTTFSFLEPGVDGTCYSVITVRPTLGDSKTFKVIKSRDPRNCVKVNDIWRTTWGQKVGNCDCTENLNERDCQCRPVNEDFDLKQPEYSRAKTITECEVKSSDMVKHIVKKCTQSAHYKYSFPGTEHQYMSTLSNQTLTLVEESDMQTVQYRDYTWKPVSQPWKHQILEQHDEKPMLTTEEILTMARSMLDELLTISNNDERFDDHLTVFTQLVDMLKLCDKDQLTTLFTETKQSENWRQWKLYIDALAHVNTTIADTFLLDKVISGDIEQNEVVPLMITWAADKVPTRVILDKFMTSVISEFEGKPNKKQSYQHSLLCLGAMARRYVHWEESQLSQCLHEQDRLQHKRNIVLARKYEKFIEEKLSSAQTDEEKITLLKALGNVGSLEALPQLQKFISPKQKTSVRVHAVYALKSLCYQNRLKVLQTIDPLLQNYNEDSEVRMAAFIITLHCKPSLTQMHRMLNREPDLDFKTFCVKFMKNILTLRSKEFELRQKWIAQVLKGIRAFQMSPKTSSIFMQFGMRPEGEGDLLSFGGLANQTSSYLRTSFVRHDSYVRGRLFNQAEFGYRLEGFEHILSKLRNRESAIRRHSELNILEQMSSKPSYTSVSYEQVKPSLTLYIKSTDRHVAFLHFDEKDINRYILQGIKSGKIEVPVKIFQTWVSKPEENQKLQPHGFWQVHERAHLMLLDVEGTIQIELQSEQLPVVHFIAKRPLRMENKEFEAQYVKCGFAHTGITTVLARRCSTSNSQWNMKYNMETRNFTYTITDPSRELERTEFKAYTNTFVMPMRLKEYVPKKEQAFRDIHTDEKDRMYISQQLDSYKSVDMNAQFDANVYVPELYTFVRDRLHLLPSRLSFHKQHIKLSLKPMITYKHTYQFSMSWKDMTSQMLFGQPEESMESLLYGQGEQTMVERQQLKQQQQQQQYQQEQQQKGMYGGWLTGMFSQTGRPSQEQTQQPEQTSVTTKFLKPSEFLKPLSVGSIRNACQVKISSISRDETRSQERRYKQMLMHLTTQYEHDTPLVRSILQIERPPIPGKERQMWTLRLDTTHTYNPSLNQMLTSQKIMYGEKDSSNKPLIDAIRTHTPTYKDDVCYEESTYGCKDRYGVTYPVWFNVTSRVQYKNTDLPLQVFRSVKEYLTNIDQSVTMEQFHEKQPRTFLGFGQPKVLNASVLFRPMDNMVDVHYVADGFKYNLSRIYLPIERAMYQEYFTAPSYPMGRVASISDSIYLPIHHRAAPFFTQRDTCVVGDSRVYSFDEKELQMPKSDCEVILVGDCGRKNKQVLITLKPASPTNSMAQKVLKTVLGETKIELQLTPATTFTRTNVKVKVNGQQQELDKNNRCVIEEGRVPVQPDNVVRMPFASRQQQQYQTSNQQQNPSQQPLAVVECMGSKCALRSQKYGVYVSIDANKVKAEIDSSVSPYMCGLCSRHPELPKQVSDDESINAFKNNRIEGEQCTTSETIDPRQSENICRSVYKHKLIHVPIRGEIMHCISTNAVPLCNNKCEKKAIKVEKHELRCINDQEAKKQEMIPGMLGEEFYLPEDRINRLMTKLSGAERIEMEMPVAESCQ